jgi:uncharacterized protein (UPF0264 family)
MTRLLVSVRSAVEAETALRGGAALIDVKDPAHGSLGRAADQVISAAARVAAGRCLLSAALGELREESAFPDEPSLAYVKWGLADCLDEWRTRLAEAMRRQMEQLPHGRTVAVAYADWQRAHAPQPETVCSFAIENRCGAFLIDTWQKDGSTLLDWLAVEEIGRLRDHCRAAGVPLALAGSLGMAEIETLLPLRPDWFAVRGAACRDRQRGAALDEQRVRQLAALLSHTQT